jgi:hypothetical protein
MSLPVYLKSTFFGATLFAAGTAAVAYANAGITVHDRTSASGAVAPEIRTVIGPEIKTAQGQKCGAVGPEVRTVIDPNYRPACAIGPEYAPASH